LIAHTQGAKIAQRGIVLISSLLLLIVVTLIALSMFRSFGIQEKIAGNMREKQRALQAAITAEGFAEAWLANNALNTPSTVCSSMLDGNTMDGTINVGQICSNQLPNVVPNNDVTAVPWQIGGTPVGVTFTPGQMQISSTPISLSLESSQTIVQNPTYAGPPTFYISDLGPSLDPNAQGEVYQIDAYAYGGTTNTVAVIESTYVVAPAPTNHGAL
jgi:type IV pilus assembly protein PilX